MDKLFEIGNSMFESASEKINALNLSEKKRYISERAGNMLGYSGTIYEIHGNRYAERSKIAEGGFGLVYLVRDDYNRQFALKRMFIQEKERLDTIINEIGIMKQLKNHKNIVKMEDYKIIENRERRETEVLILLEFCAGGSVLDIMNHRGEQSRLSEREILAIFSDTCNAVAELHNQQPPFAHRDLKIENILYCENSGCYKLCDFGSATIKTYDTGVDSDRNRAEDDINTYTTLFYRAPEMVDLYRRQVINEKVDIWALGCLLFKMAFYVDPFDGALAIMNSRYQIPSNSRYSQNLHNLIEFCLVSDPAQRPTIYDVISKLEEIRGGGSSGRRQGLQTFSPQKPQQQQQRPLSYSDPSRTTSNNSTPSLSSPASTSNRSSPASTPTTARKQNLFDVLEWSDSNGNQSGSSSHSGTPQPMNSNNSSYQNSPVNSVSAPLQQQKTQAPSLLDDFDWSSQPSTAVSSPVPAQRVISNSAGNTPKTSTFNSNNNFNNNNSNNDQFSQFVSSSSNSDFDFDPFSSSTTLKPQANNTTKPIQQQQPKDEISFETVNVGFNNMKLNNNNNVNNNNINNTNNNINNNKNNNNSNNSNGNNNYFIKNNNTPQQSNYNIDFSTSSPTPNRPNTQTNTNMSNGFSQFNFSTAKTNTPTTATPSSNGNNNNSFTSLDQPLKPNMKNGNTISPQASATAVPTKPNYNIDLNAYTQNNNNNNFYGNNSNLKQQGPNNQQNNKPANNPNQAFNFDSFAMYNNQKK